MNHEKKILYTPQYNINKSKTDTIKINKTINKKDSIQKRNFYIIQNSLYNKWNEIIINFEEYKINNKKELKKLTRLGIPDNLRGFIWQKFSGIEKSNLKNQYNEFKENNKNLPNKNEEDIIKDLFRTSHSTFFKNKFGLGQINLYNVLSTFSNQSETGYVQGMSFLCASFLSYMNEESAFWMMKNLMEKYNMKGYFQNNFPELKRSYYKLLKLLKNIFPKIYFVLKKWKIFPDYYARQWFLTLFFLDVNYDVFLRILDIFLLEKNFKIIYRISLALLKLNEEKIYNAENFSDLMIIFKDIGKDLTVNQLFTEGFKIKIHINILEKYGQEYDDLKEKDINDEIMEQLIN